MKTLIITVMLLMSASVANAVPTAFPLFAGIFGLGVVALQDAEKGIPACYYEPIRTVKWVGQPGYSFEVAGCDYQAKKDRLVVIK